MFGHSNHTGKGLYAALDSAVAFLPFKFFTDSDQLDKLLSIFDSSASGIVNTTSIKGLQYAIQRDWLTDGQVPQAEIILWSRGEVDTKENASYIYILGGAMVCAHLYTFCPTIKLTSDEASYE